MEGSIDIATAAPYIGLAAFVAAVGIIHKILHILSIQCNICMYINTIVATDISRCCFDLSSIWMYWLVMMGDGDMVQIFAMVLVLLMLVVWYDNITWFGVVV